jgi:hypothetical protein
MRRFLVLPIVLVLSACGSKGPPVPDWKTDSANFIERYEKAYLNGQNTLADQYFSQALNASSGTGKIARTARLWLIQCALHKAGRTPDTCDQYQTLANIDTTPEDRAYFRFLGGNWDGLDIGRLPSQYVPVVKASSSHDPTKIDAALRDMTNPLSRLIAIGILLDRREIDDRILDLAARTASDQGWRRPLLVYLRLQATRAQQRGDQQAIKRFDMQIKLVEQALSGTR